MINTTHTYARTVIAKFTLTRDWFRQNDKIKFRIINFTFVKVVDVPKISLKPPGLIYLINDVNAVTKLPRKKDSTPNPGFPTK